MLKFYRFAFYFLGLVSLAASGQKQPTADETKNWLEFQWNEGKEIPVSHSSAVGKCEQGTLFYSTTISNWDTSCILKGMQYTNSYCHDGIVFTSRYKFTLNLGFIDPGRLEMECSKSCVFTFHATNNKKMIPLYYTGTIKETPTLVEEVGKENNEPTMAHTIKLVLEKGGEPLGQRAKKAFTHLIRVCGGKEGTPEPF